MQQLIRVQIRRVLRGELYGINKRKKVKNLGLMKNVISNIKCQEHCEIILGIRTCGTKSYIIKKNLINLQEKSIEYLGVKL